MIIFWSFLAYYIYITVRDKQQCDCNRSRQPFFGKWHIKEWVMLADAISYTQLVMVQIIFRTFWWPLIIIAAPYIVYIWGRWWKHRQGKTTVLGKILGRVTQNQHGKLIIVKE